MSEVKILATVAGENITESDLAEYIEKLPREQQAYASNPYFQQQLLEQVINTHLIAKLAEEQKLDESEDFLNTMKKVRRDVLAQFAIAQIVNKVTVSDEDAEAYFNANIASFSKGESVAAKHILVDSEELCTQLLTQIQNGEISFEDAAKANSTCPSKERGGDLGEFGHGAMVPEFDQAAFSAEINDVVGPVKTQFGYHLIQVYKKTEASVPTFAEIAENVKANLLNERQTEAIQSALTELKARYM